MAQRSRRYTPFQFLNTGTFGKTITVDLFEDGDSFFDGDIFLLSITGSLLDDTDDEFFDGIIQLQSGAQPLSGSLFDDDDNLFTGTLTREAGTQTTTRLGVMGLPGANLNFSSKDLSPVQDIASEQFLTDADTFFDGLLEGGLVDLQGNLFEDADTLNHGLITYNINNTILTDGDTFFDGIVSFAKPISGSLLDDSDTFFDGLVSPLSISGGLFEDSDTFFDGLLTINVEGQLFSDDDTLNHGLISIDISGGLFEDTDTFNNGQQGFGAVNLSGSLLEDADTLFHGTISFAKIIQGEPIDEANEFFNSRLDPVSLIGQFLDAEDETFFDGIVASQNQIVSQEIFEDEDTFFNGAIDKQDLQGGNLQGQGIKLIGTESSFGASINHTVDIPDGSDIVGRLVIVGVASDGAVSFSWPTGWTEIFDDSASLVSLGIAYRVIDGTEGFSGTSDTITVSTSADEFTSHVSYLFENFNENFIEATTKSTGTNTSPNSGENTPTHGYNEYVFISFHAHDVGSTTTTAFPSGYGVSLSTQGGSTEGCGIGAAILTKTDSSEDPGAFTISQTRNWIAATVSILSVPVEDEDEFFGGVFAFGSTNISGGLFEDTDTFNAGHAYFGIRLSSAQRNRTASTIDPPSFTIEETSNWIAGTILIRGS